MYEWERFISTWNFRPYPIALIEFQEAFSPFFLNSQSMTFKTFFSLLETTESLQKKIILAKVDKIHFSRKNFKERTVIEMAHLKKKFKYQDFKIMKISFFVNKNSKPFEKLADRIKFKI